MASHLLLVKPATLGGAPGRFELHSTKISWVPEAKEQKELHVGLLSISSERTISCCSHMPPLQQLLCSALGSGTKRAKKGAKLQVLVGPDAHTCG